MSAVVGSSRSATLSWSAALAAVTIVGTLATACMMPFVALGVVSAATMPRARAVAILGTAWATNQLLGFTLLGYPRTEFAFAWGAALGAASLLAMLAAASVLRRRLSSILDLAMAFAAAFAVYEGALFGFALMAGGTETFTPSIVLRILVNEACWFTVLVALHLALTRAAPRIFGSAPALRLA